MDGYEVKDANGNRGWWDGRKVTPLGSNGLPMKAGSGGAPSLSPTDAKALQEARDEAAKNLNTAQQAGRFIDINRDVGTGGMAGMGLGIGSAWRSIRSASDPRYADMEAITSAVAPGLRPPGSGSSSDKDVQFYTKGFPNTQVPGPTNKATYDRLHDQSDRSAAHAAFIDKWAANRGSLFGAEQAFAQYWAKKSGASNPNPFAQGNAAAQPGSGPKAPHQLSDAELKAQLGL